MGSSGMADIVDVMGALLRRHQVPTVAAISEVLSPFTGGPARDLGLQINRHLVSHFFCHKGRVEYVVKAAINEASRFYDDREGESTQTAKEGCPFRVYHGLPI